MPGSRQPGLPATCCPSTKRSLRHWHHRPASRTRKQRIARSSGPDSALPIAGSRAKSDSARRIAAVTTPATYAAARRCCTAAVSSTQRFTSRSRPQPQPEVAAAGRPCWPPPRQLTIDHSRRNRQMRSTGNWRSGPTGLARRRYRAICCGKPSSPGHACTAICRWSWPAISGSIFPVPRCCMQPRRTIRSDNCSRGCHPPRSKPTIDCSRRYTVTSAEQRARFPPGGHWC